MDIYESRTDISLPLNFYITKNSNELIVTQSIHKKTRLECNYKSCYQLLMISKDDFGIFKYMHLG